DTWIQSSFLLSPTQLLSVVISHRTLTLFMSLSLSLFPSLSLSLSLSLSIPLSPSLSVCLQYYRHSEDRGLHATCPQQQWIQAVCVCVCVCVCLSVCVSVCVCVCVFVCV